MLFFKKNTLIIFFPFFKIMDRGPGSFKVFFHGYFGIIAGPLNKAREEKKNSRGMKGITV